MFNSKVIRWFQIFYLTIATYFMGSTLGNLGTMKSEILNIRRKHAWEQRKVTKRFTDDMQAYDHDDKVDEFEILSELLIDPQQDFL